MPMPPLEETFAGNRWRVVDRPGNPAGRFVVLGIAPGSLREEVEVCAVQYRPHAEAIAALPELARLVALSDDKSARRSPAWFAALFEARNKAEGRAA